MWDYFPDEDDAFWLQNSTIATAVEGKETAVLPPRFAGEYFIENMENTGDFTNWGIFADATYDITETIRIAAGLRYSYDEKDFTWQTDRTGNRLAV